MTSHLDSVTMADNTSWKWNLIPLLAAALALGVVLFPQGNLPAEDGATQATASEAQVPAAAL